MWNGQIIDDTKESYYDFIDEAKDKLFEIVSDLNNDGGEYAISDLKEAIEEHNSSVDNVVELYHDTQYKHITIEDLHLKTNSYKWMKKHIKEHGFDNHIEHLVYLGIKRGMSVEEFIKFVTAEIPKCKRLLTECCPTWSLKITGDEFPKFLKNYSDETWEVYNYNNWSKGPNDVDKYTPKYRQKGSTSNYGQINTEYRYKESDGKGYNTLSLYIGKIYDLESNNHPVYAEVYGCMPYNYLSSNHIATDAKFIAICCGFFKIIKTLDTEFDKGNLTFNKKLGGEWERPLTPNEIEAKKKKEKEANLPKAIRKMLNYVRNYHLENTFKELL